MGLLQHSDAARRWFSLLASGYDTVVAPLFWSDSVQREGLERLGLDGSDRVLDVGCGTGQTAEHLLRQAGAVHGLDQSGEQLEVVTGKEELRDADFVRGDAHRLPYLDETFDHVVSIGSILYWQKPEQVLREALRVTKPGGTILVMGFNKRALSPWNPTRNIQVSVNAALFHRYSPGEATRVFQEAGWTNVENGTTGPGWSPDLQIITTARKPDSRHCLVEGGREASRS